MASPNGENYTPPPVFVDVRVVKVWSTVPSIRFQGKVSKSRMIMFLETPYESLTTDFRLVVLFMLFLIVLIFHHRFIVLYPRD